MLPIQIFNHLVLEHEERLEQLRLRNIERRILRSDSDPFSTTDEQFIGHFRLTKEMGNTRDVWAKISIFLQANQRFPK